MTDTLERVRVMSPHGSAKALSSAWRNWSSSPRKRVSTSFVARLNSPSLCSRYTPPLSRNSEADAALYLTVPVGLVDEAWLKVRSASHANLSGKYCDVADSATIAALRPTFGGLDVGLGLADFDSSALQNSEPRELTQRVGRAVYEMSNDEVAPSFDGVRFLPRHGYHLDLWSILERSTDGAFSAQLSDIVAAELRPGHPDVEAEMRLHGLNWGSVERPLVAAVDSTPSFAFMKES